MKRVVWIVLIAFSIPPVAATAQFKPVMFYKIGYEDKAYRLITGDFNNDGNLDLAVADYLSSRVSILLGNGDGTFQKPSAFPVPYPVALAAGDLTKDGNQDLLVVEYGGTGYSSLGVFLGDGNGHFREGGTYRLGIQSLSVTTADFNGDGRLDVAAANEGLNGKGGSVMVFLGNGDGTLKKPTTYGLPNYPYWVETGDLNGDGHADLIVTEAAGGAVAVLLNTGNGRFQAPATYSTGGDLPISVAVGDVNHDGKPDLVVANENESVAVLLNEGHGTFGNASILSFPWCHNGGSCESPFAVVIADFNLDGNADIAAASLAGPSALFYGKGDGKFEAAVRIKDGMGGGWSLAAGDFNHDGAPDLAIPFDATNRIAVMINTQ
jgi:hypothetical protein